MASGIVFDIQRFVLHDGPGIRTVVSFKGCPLRCPWCHNPEARRSEQELAYLVNRCISCGVCSRVCPNHAVKFFADQSHIILRDRCVICGRCVDACVSRALVLTGQKMSVEQVMVEVRKDRLHYEKTGGGLTISGGEPTMQIDFLAAVLQAARDEGINTCVQTNGCAPQEDYRRIAPLTDYFLYDYKATGLAYQEMVGIDEAVILENLEFLYEQGANITLRCPLIPGVNDVMEHLEAIAGLDRKYPALRGIEILPYHNIYTSKFERYGYINPLPNQPAASESDRQRWISALTALGCTRVQLAAMNEFAVR